jgi:hypothetical protein
MKDTRPRLLVELQTLAKRKHYGCQALATATGLNLTTCRRFLRREASPYLRNLETILDFLREAEPRELRRRRRRAR